MENTLQKHREIREQKKKVVNLWALVLMFLYPITAAAFRKAIKDTHCIQFIYANEHNFKQNYAMLNQKVLS